MPSIWTTPVTKADQDPTLFGDWNTYLRDNLLYLYDRAINNSGILIASTTVAGAATYTFSAIPGTYKHLRIRGYNLQTVTAHTYLSLRFNGDTGNNYNYMNSGGNQLSAAVLYGAGTTNGIRLIQSDALRNSTTQTMSMDMVVYSYVSPSLYKNVNGVGISEVYSSVIGGNWASIAAITSLTLLTGSGNNFSGELELWGFG